MTDSGVRPATVMVVDDDENILQVLEARLLTAGYTPLLADCGETALEMLAGEDVDLVVSDVKMPGMGGVGLLNEITTSWPHIPVIMLTAHGTIPDAVNSIQTGAADYLTKPFDGKELVRRIRVILDNRSEGKPVPPAAAKGAHGLRGGAALAMRRFLDLLERVAVSTANVLLFGESGTGKEKAARYLHDSSPRHAGPFVVVDCGSTQPTLLESELFGHVKGAFTHALKDKKGLIEEADGGTLFLDEIGNISKDMQTRLLRFLQEGTIRRVGDNKQRTVTCRVVAATNANLPELVACGEFREDLYYRLKVVSLTIPPLRERMEDVPELAAGFVEDLCREQKRPVARIDAKAMDLLTRHTWPGNVRELKHALEAGLVFCREGVIRAEDLQLESVHADEAGEVSSSFSLEDNERRAILNALEHSRWVKKDAADKLGISRRAIHYKIKKYGIDDLEDPD